MRAIKSKNTGPEMVIRRLAHNMGYRYRLHRNDLPGKPDLAFSRRRKLIFIHGCFWHRHDCKRGNRIPKVNQDYWIPKLQRNKRRDVKSQCNLKQMGWDVLIIWECEIKDSKSLSVKIQSFLDH